MPAAALGIALIGLLNFGVSFALALAVALRARDVGTGERLTLLKSLLARLRRAPGSFVLAPARPRESAAPADPRPHG